MSRILFSRWKQRIEALPSLSERQSEAEKLYILACEAGVPLIEDDSQAVFLYRGDASEVFLFGDMTNWLEKKAFTRLAGTDLFYLKEVYSPVARLQYWLMIDDQDMPVLDPSNPNRIGNGLGLMSELTMPAYIRDPLFAPFADGGEGSLDGLHAHTLPAGRLSYEHNIHVFKPEGIGPFPVVYFQDGLDYLRFAHAPAVLKNLIEKGGIPPCIGVFVTPPNLHLNKVPNRSTEYGLNDDYVIFFCDELVPFIEGRYPTINNSRSRVVVGDSYGGLASTFIGVSRPELFGQVCSQSGYYSFQDDLLIRKIEEMPVPELRLYFHVGTYEHKIGSSFIPSEEQDFTAANFRMKDVLEKKGWNYRFRLSEEGHTWGNWRGHLAEALIYLMNEPKELKC